MTQKCKKSPEIYVLLSHCNFWLHRTVPSLAHKIVIKFLIIYANQGCLMGVDKFIVQGNITSNKLRGFETCFPRESPQIKPHIGPDKGPDTRIFPITRMWYIHASAREQIPLFSKFCFHQIALSTFAACLWEGAFLIIVALATIMHKSHFYA